MNRRYYELAKNSAVFYERCYVNKLCGNDLALIGQKACANYLKHIIDVGYDHDWSWADDSVKQAMYGIDLQSLSNVLIYSFGIELPEDTIRLLRDVNKYADVDNPYVDIVKVSMSDIGLMQKAIEQCKIMADTLGSVNKNDKVTDLLKAAEGGE